MSGITVGSGNRAGTVTIGSGGRNGGTLGGGARALFTGPSGG